MADPPKAPGAGPPPQPQLSPLSGAYLLIVVGEPFSEEHKKLILQKLQQGLLTWNSGATLVELEQELNTISDCSPPGEEARGGERLIQFATENLVTEVLIHPQVNTLQQCMKNMLASFTKHRHIIHAGYTFAGKGSWILQDGTYSFADFTAAFEEYDVQRVIRSYENSISVHVHCCQEGDWKQDKVDEQPFAKLCQVELNPDSQMSESEAVSTFITYMEPFLQPQSIQERLPPSDVVGNIRFSHPTLYVFPGGQGDSALFGINGFNMLIDGGFSRKACFWDFTRHLDRLDAILVTRLSDENTQGISQVLERKSAEPVYPQIGHFFANILDTGASNKEKYDEEEKDKLLVNVIHEGNSMIENLRILNLKPQICFRDNICDPINLYHKVGHGKLDMYVLNPSKESREVKEFLSRWSEDVGQLGSMKSGINVDGKELWLPIANLVSICALLIWQPANPNDTITRLLFPGSTPQNKIFKGLEKLRKLECLKHATCSSSSLKEAKTGRHSKEKRRTHKTEAKASQPDNSVLERKEKLARRKQEKSRKEKEERERQEREKREEKEKRDRQKEENENFEKEKRERLEKLERKKKAEKERRDKERQEQSEKDALAKKEKEEKQAAAKKEKEEKDAAAKREKDEKDAVIKKERDEKRKEREEKQKQAVKKDKEIPTDVVKEEEKLKKKIPAIKSKPRDTPKLKKTEVKQDSNDSIKTRKVMPSKPLVKSSTPPPSKLKKDESNKKVMETRKAAAAKSHKKQPDNEEKSRLNKSNRVVSATKKQSKKTSPPDDKPVDEKSVVERVSQAIASGAIDDSRVIKDDEDDRESIVEKDQIEEMETSPDNHQDKDFVKALDDDEEVELQRIKDEEDDDNQQREPDIGENELKKEAPPSPPKDLVLEQSPPKVAYSHVKTPDEVDDLPEHEVVNPDESMLEEIKSEMSYDLEEKIAKDESEKENNLVKKDKSEGSVEALKGNEEVEVPIEQKSLPAVKGEGRSESKHSEEVKEVAKIEFETSITVPKIEQSEDIGEIDYVSDETPIKHQETTYNETEKEKDEAEENASFEGANDEEKEQGKLEVHEEFLSNTLQTEERQEPSCKDSDEEDNEGLDASAFERDETAPNIQSDDAFINHISEAEGRQDPVVTEVEDIGDILEVKDDENDSLPNAKDEEKEQDKDEAKDEFLNNISTAEGRQESDKIPKKEDATLSDKKEAVKASEDTEGKNIDENAEEAETTSMVKSIDTFVNEISETEGRQEALAEEVEDIGDIQEVEDDTNTPLLNAKNEENQQDTDEAQDGFLNNISTAEGRQETACKEAEEEDKEKLVDESPCQAVEVKVLDKDNVEESDETPKEEDATISSKNETVKDSEDLEGEDIDQNREGDETALVVKSDDAFVNEISEIEGRQEAVIEEIEDIEHIDKVEEDKIAPLQDAKIDEKVESKEESQDGVLNIISTAEGRQETAFKEAEEEDKVNIEDDSPCKAVEVNVLDKDHLEETDETPKKEEVAVADKNESIRASKDNIGEGVDQSAEEDETDPIVKSDDAFGNIISESEGRQEAVTEKSDKTPKAEEATVSDKNESVKASEDTEVEDIEQNAKEDESAPIVKCDDAFVNIISESEGRQEVVTEEFDETPKEEETSVSDKKESLKAAEDTEGEDIDQKAEEDETTQIVKSDDAFVNIIPEGEGRPEAVTEESDETPKEEETRVSDKKESVTASEDTEGGYIDQKVEEDETAPIVKSDDAFVNIIAESEGRQEAVTEESDETQKEEEAALSYKKESLKGSADTEGEDIDPNAKEDKTAPIIKSDDEFVNIISESERRQEAVPEEFDETPKAEEATLSDKKESVNASEDTEGTDIDQNAENNETAPIGKSDDSFTNIISVSEGRQEAVTQESDVTPKEEEATVSDKKESVKASEDTEGEDIGQNVGEGETAPMVKSDDTFVNVISETEGRQDAVSEESDKTPKEEEATVYDKKGSVKASGDTEGEDIDQNVEKDEPAPIVKSDDAFVNTISETEGRQEAVIEESDETPKEEEATVSDKKESVKVSEDTEGEDIDQNSGEGETSPMVKSDDTFVNLISETEGRQEAVTEESDETPKEEEATVSDKKESVKASEDTESKNIDQNAEKDETDPIVKSEDSFVNIISESEGRQEAVTDEYDETSKEEEATVSDKKESVKASEDTEGEDIDQNAGEGETAPMVKSDDTFANVISETEGRQEAVTEESDETPKEEEAKVSDKMESVQASEDIEGEYIDQNSEVVETAQTVKSDDAFVNIISESEGRQVAVTEEYDETPKEEEATVSDKKESVKASEDNEGEDLDQKAGEGDPAQMLKPDDTFENVISETEGRQEAVTEEIEDIGHIQEDLDDKSQLLHDAKDEEKEQDMKASQDTFLNNIATVEGRQETACKGAEEEDKAQLDEDADIDQNAGEGETAPVDKSDDAFVNIISETEWRQEAVTEESDETPKEEEVTVSDKKESVKVSEDTEREDIDQNAEEDETAPIVKSEDAFLNIIAESEGRQEAVTDESDETSKEDEETVSDKKESVKASEDTEGEDIEQNDGEGETTSMVKSDDTFVNVISETEGRQEAVTEESDETPKEEEATVSDKKESVKALEATEGEYIDQNAEEDETAPTAKSDDAFVNIISESEGRQKAVTENSDETPNVEEATVSDKNESVKASGDDEGEDLDQNPGEGEVAPMVKSDDTFVNVISETEGRQEAVTEEVEDIGHIQENVDDKSQLMHDAKDEEKEQDTIKAQDTFLNNIATVEGRQETARKDSEEEDKVQLDEEAQCQEVSHKDNVEESEETQSIDSSMIDIAETKGRKEIYVNDSEDKENTGQECAETSDLNGEERDNSFKDVRVESISNQDEEDDKPGLVWADEVEKESKIKAEEYEMNIAKAEKVVEEIVNKAEKVMGQVQEKLNENDAKKDSTESLSEFSKISQESKEVVQKLEESYIQEKGSIKNTEKKESTSSVSFQHIEQESKEIVSKLEESFHDDLSSSTGVLVHPNHGDRNDEKETSSISKDKEDEKSIKNEETNALSLTNVKEDCSSSNLDDVNPTVAATEEEEKLSLVKDDKEPIITLEGDKGENSSIHEENEDISYSREGKLETGSVKDEQVASISLINGKNDSILTTPDDKEFISLITDHGDKNFTVDDEKSGSSNCFENYEPSEIKDTSSLQEAKIINEVKEEDSLITKDEEDALPVKGNKEDASYIKDKKDEISTGVEGIDLFISLKDDREETSSIHEEKDDIIITKSEKLETGSVKDDQIDDVSLTNGKDDSSMTKPEHIDSNSLSGKKEGESVTLDDKEGASSNTLENGEPNDTSSIPESRTIKDVKENVSLINRDKEESSFVQDNKKDVSSVKDIKHEISTGMGEEEQTRSLQSDIEPVISLKNDKEKTSSIQDEKDGDKSMFHKNEDVSVLNSDEVNTSSVNDTEKDTDQKGEDNIKEKDIKVVDDIQEIGKVNEVADTSEKKVDECSSSDQTENVCSGSEQIKSEVCSSSEKKEEQDSLTTGEEEQVFSGQAHREVEDTSSTNYVIVDDGINKDSYENMATNKDSCHSQDLEVVSESFSENIIKSKVEASESIKNNKTEQKVDESSATAIQLSQDKCAAEEPSHETMTAENIDTQSAEKPEMVKHGVLQVKVIGATDLVNKDILGKSDPYIIVTLNDKKFRSQTVSNSLEPQWNFCSTFDVSESDEYSIQFDVFDDDFGMDQAQGSCSMTVKEAISEESISWLTLHGCKSGKISVAFEFTESTAEDKYIKNVAKEVTDLKEENLKESSGKLVLAEEHKEDVTKRDKTSHQQPEDVSTRERKTKELKIETTDALTSKDDSSQIQTSSNGAGTNNTEKSTFAEHHGKSFDGESTSYFSTELSERRASADEAQIIKPIPGSEQKGFMANLKGTIGGFFFKQEDTIVEDEDVKGEARIPREFMMQTETYSTEGASLTTKQPENLKDIPIMEEIEPVENENEDTYPQLSLPPIESLSQSENSGPDESDKQKAVSNKEGKVKSVNLQKEVDEIEFIISNLFTVLGELSESVGCSKTIQAMRVDLDSIKQSTSELDDNETELVLVMSSLQGVVLRAKQQGAEVKPNPVPKATFDRLLEACQKICNTANFQSLESNSSNTSEITSPVVEDSKQQAHKQDENLEGAGAEEQQTSTDEILEEETDSNNAVLSKEKTEGIGKLKATVIEETVSPETVSNDPPASACQDEGKEDGAEESADSQDADRLHSNPQPNLDSHSETMSPSADVLQCENEDNNDVDDDDEEEEEASSDYKAIPETSTGAEKTASLMAADSGTEDQISSGTFSQEDLSPRFADLPQQLSSRAEQVLAEDLKLTKKDRTLSMETRTTSITSDASEQEIPPSSPRSALTLSPTTESSTSTTAKFMYGETIEKSVTDSVDIMTQSIYIGSEDCDSEMSSESHQSVVSQTTQRKVSTSEESNVKTTVKSEYVVSEAVVKVSENVAETILEETKSITKKAEVVSKEEIKVDYEKSKETTVEKFVETRQEAKLSYSEVVRADTSKSIKATEEKSVAQEAVAEVLKTDTVLQLVDSKDEPAGSSSNGKKMSYSEVLRSDKLKDDPIADWGKPLGLPSPNRPSTPAKQAKKKEDEVPVDTNKDKTPDSVEPVWLDLAYVPHHGSSNYANAEFFKRVRARYYVFSGVEPSREVFNALLEAKKTWENKEQEVTIIPTYDTDVLGYWVAENEELLTELKIDLAPSASRCTINLQDHATSCAAYRLEF